MNILSSGHMLHDARRARIIRRSAVSLVCAGTAMSFAVVQPGAVDSLGAAWPASAEESAPRMLQVDIDDTVGILSDADRRLLETQAAQLNFPPEVNALRFVVLDEVRDVNRQIKAYAREHHPDWIDGEIWADGQVVFTLAYSSRQYGVTCGYDTCQSMQLDDYGRRDTVLKTLAASIKTSHYAEGLYRAARELAEPSHNVEPRPEPPRGTQILALAGIMVGIGALAAAAWAARRRRA